ncbi:hypothetical protein VNO78_31333 [Psophocarpus tetragonolobus]|uniref:Uncharacterized protein n=1 Tax=Psophocarpus tetragonolobus TaxID=3891 RepID=A0AAN9X7F5_PSOTE
MALLPPYVHFLILTDPYTMKFFWFLQCLFCMAMLLINPSLAPNAPAPPSRGFPPDTPLPPPRESAVTCEGGNRKVGISHTILEDKGVVHQSLHLGVLVLMTPSNDMIKQAEYAKETKFAHKAEQITNAG